MDGNSKDEIDIYLYQNKGHIYINEEDGFKEDDHKFGTNMSEDIESSIIKYHRHVWMKILEERKLS